jgi:hypothetical protein
MLSVVSETAEVEVAGLDKRCRAVERRATRSFGLGQTHGIGARVDRRA